MAYKAYHCEMGMTQKPVTNTNEIMSITSACRQAGITPDSYRIKKQ